MKRVSSRFTLLEVIIALAILAVGMGVFLAEMSFAARRVANSYRDWEQTHELATAAEYLLLAGPEAKLDEDFLNDRYQVDFEYLEAELPDYARKETGDMELVTLAITLSDREGEEIDSLRVDCWKRESAHVP